MAAKPPKTSLQPITESEPTNKPLTDLTSLNLEDLLSDSLLESIDWSKVKTLMIEKAQSKFWAWITAAASNTDVSLALLPDAIAIGASEVSDA
jgi:hypothetical protein